VSTVHRFHPKCKHCSHLWFLLTFWAEVGYYLVMLGNEGTPRARARAAALEDIKQAARLQLADSGAAALSVRHVARQVGMCSSGVYRYFGSRDELLTALILDAFNSLGDRVERAEAEIPRADRFGRWWAVACAVRDWAFERPQEYGLVFGSPIPGYEAPEDTIIPAARVPMLLAQILRDAYDEAGGELVTTTETVTTATGIAPGFSASVPPLLGLPDDLVACGILAWSELFGLISFELFGHGKNIVANGDELFRFACERTASSLGITVKELAHP
jgi:AcrR family transcriptional regulator